MADEFQVVELNKLGLSDLLLVAKGKITVTPLHIRRSHGLVVVAEQASVELSATWGGSPCAACTH